LKLNNKIICRIVNVLVIFLPKKVQGQDDDDDDDDNNDDGI
jgi:hypothetical protein